MDVQLLLEGFYSLMNFETLLWIVIGVSVGTLVGALPGLGPTAGIAILLPMSFSLSPINALMLLMGIYQGTMYGGRISSILINVPGDAQAVVTTFDGYPLTKKGRAGYALGLSAIASFIGGIIGFIGLIFLTPFVAGAAYIFGPAEYFALMVFALIATSGLGGNNLIKGLIALVFGLIIATVGSDAIEGSQRLTYGFVELWDGINFVVVAIGLFGFSEVLKVIEDRINTNDGINLSNKIPFKDLFPKVKDVINNWWAIIRGSLMGFFVGVLPGAGATIATFLSYSTEKKLSKKPEDFGQGAEQGVSGPEAANNASVGGALIPLFSLGIPGSGTTAILLGALIMLGLQPGPLMFERSGDIIWATIAGLILANIILLLLNTIFVPVFTFMIQKSQQYIGPLIAALCFIGVYMLRYSFFDVGLMIIFGIIGFFMRKFNFPIAPLLLAVVLGSIMEKSFRQALLQTQGDLSIFFTRPISLTLLLITVVILFLPVIKLGYRKNIKNKM